MHIGIVGAGQLGRMMALAGHPLGLRFAFLDGSADAPGACLGEMLLGAFDDTAALAELASRVDVLTFDVENVPADALREAIGRTPFFPPIDALATAQDRLLEKTLFTELGIATPRWCAIDGPADLHAAAETLGLPFMLKNRRLGYDGRGQTLVREAGQLVSAWEGLGAMPAIGEAFVEFEREVSAIGVRGRDGRRADYPLSHNEHVDGVLRTTIAPYADDALERQGRDIMATLLEHFGYVGVLTVEFFVRDGVLLANEIAPRVHNSGHWTIEGAVTSQFENHLRAVAGLPLGSTAARGHSAMVNFLGTMPPPQAVLAIDGAHMHDYGKAPRPGRKLGHATVTAATAAARDARLAQLRATLPGG